METDKKWYVSLGEGTWVALDELPFVFLASDEQIRILEDKYSGEAPVCQSEKGDEVYDTHIHIRDLVNESHWADHADVDGNLSSRFDH